MDLHSNLFANSVDISTLVCDICSSSLGRSDSCHRRAMKPLVAQDMLSQLRHAPAERGMMNEASRHVSRLIISLPQFPSYLLSPTLIPLYH